jgi:lysozyme
VLNGIDVHDAQGAIKWAQVAQNNQFAFVRGAYGTKLDGLLEDNFSGAKANGMACGVYHFLRATQDYQTQADIMCKALKQANVGKGDLPPVIDVEDNPHYDGPWNPANNGKYLAGVKLWLDQVSNAAKCKPIIYTRASFWSVLDNPAGFETYPLWVAHYTSNPAPILPDGWSSYAFWQYAEAGTTPGVPGTGDLDRFNGQQADLDKLRIA